MNADIVICVGPRLHRFTRDTLVARGRSEGTVYSLNCGLSPPSYPRVPPIAPTILCLGRTESLGVKGLDIFAYAAGHLMNSWMSHPSTSSRPAPTFVVRGAQNDGEALEAKLATLAAELGTMPHFVARPYTTIQEDLAADYLGASIFVMPSREEGFGLVACEALSQGVPVLLSSESGVSEVVRTVIQKHHMRDNPCLISMQGDPKEVGRRFADAALDVLMDEELATDYYQVLRERLLPVSSWDAGARHFLQIFDNRRSEGTASAALPSSIPVAPPLPSGLSQEAVNELMAKQGVVAVSLKQAVVVVVEKGNRPNLPAEIDGIEIVVREIESVRLSAEPTFDTSDGVYVDNIRRASIALTLVGHDQQLYALTAAHALVDRGSGTVSVKVNSVVSPVLESVKSVAGDWVLLRIGKQPFVSKPFAPVFPAVEESVRIAIGSQVWPATISSTDVTARIAGQAGKFLYSNLIELKVEGTLPQGISGALVVSSHQKPIAMIIAAIVSTEGTVTSFYAVPLSSIAALQQYSVAELQPLGRRNPSLRVGIVTSTPEELGTLVSAGSINWIRALNKEFASIVGEMDQGSVEIIAVTSERFGAVATAIATADLVLRHDPHLIIHLGLCGGLMKDRQQVGDVVVSSEVISFAGGSLRSGRLRHDIQIVSQGNNRLERRLRSQPLQVRMSDQMHKGDKIGIHFGQIASIDYVVDSEELLYSVNLTSRNVLALDMESSGFSQAVQRFRKGGDFPLMVVVKGISDFPSSKEKQDFSDLANTRRLAAMNASLVALELIRLVRDDAL